MWFHLCQLDISSDANIADIIEAWRPGNLLKGILAILDIGMIRCDAKTNKAVGHRKLFIHVDDGILDLVDQAMGYIESRWSRSNNCEAEASSRCRRRAIRALVAS